MTYKIALMGKAGKSQEFEIVASGFKVEGSAVVFVKLENGYTWNIASFPADKVVVAEKKNQE